jgi:hypothetical protein
MRVSLPDARPAGVQSSKCRSQAMDGILGTDRFRWLPALRKAPGIEQWAQCQDV